jgi:phage terminase large subunit GpA-like protein
MFQWEVVGYGKDNESWGIEWGQIVGDMSKPETWRELDKILQRKYKRPKGYELGIASAMIDSGGHFTQNVYSFCRLRQYKRIYAIKGRGGEGVPILSKPHTVEPSKALLYNLGVDQLKADLYHRLGIKEIGPGYCHYPIAFGADYFEQLTAEELQTVFKKGFPHKQWVKKTNSIRNEALDIRAYAHAAVLLLRPDWDALAKGVNPPPPEPTQEIGKPTPAMPLKTGYTPSKPARGASWLNGWK